ncbi:hypothetical protein [Pedobacter rhodius]|uniref:Uncharacterized protein n=1 Tax=Pedobacter rhodius TaxID=3004098 RepID=A0ABT4KVW1_9SPHI|nr:hypothetical protein [Pedobacter sp. SJ11]MCZ4222910.1 hypothetical protein [Pedobacter sp. SJ11]
MQPISDEFNRQYISGKGLDTNYFNPNDVMQYYQVSNYEDLADNQILSELEVFATTRFPSYKLQQLRKLTLLFYKKKMFIDYQDHLYESARENDNRRLEGHAKELLASITLERTNKNSKNMSRKSVLYDNGKFKMKLIDTIFVR